MESQKEEQWRKLEKVIVEDLQRNQLWEQVVAGDVRGIAEMTERTAFELNTLGKAGIDRLVDERFKLLKSDTRGYISGAIFGWAFLETNRKLRNN